MEDGGSITGPAGQFMNLIGRYVLPGYVAAHMGTLMMQLNQTATQHQAIEQVKHVAATNPMSLGGIGLDLLVIFILILINGFFSASEMAIVTLNDAKVKKEAADGNKAAAKILHFISNPSAFLATIQVGVTLAGFLSSAFAGEKFADRLVLWLDPMQRVPHLKSLAVVLVTLLVAYLSLVFGELVPKRLALNNPERFSKKYIGLLRVIDLVLKPFTKLLTFSTNVILKLLRISPQAADNKVSEEEIRMMVDVGMSSGTIHAEESQMIQNIFEFNDKEVSEIMTHRTDMVALDIKASYEEVIEVALSEKYSRIPVYEEDIDDIQGVLTIRDLLFYTAKAQHDAFDLRKLLRPVYRVPESKHVDALFRDMQNERVSMAIVIDEYGGTSGLVTVEDLLEEIVGNIEDEYDEQEIAQEYSADAQGYYELDAMESLETIKKFIPELRFEEDDYEDFDTLAGFVLDALGYIPEDGDRPEVVRHNMKIQILEVEDHRITRVKLKIVEEEAANKVDPEKDEKD